METLVRVGAIDAVKVKVFPNKEGKLTANVSFDTPLNLESITRLFHMVNGSTLMSCTFASSQLVLDLKVSTFEVNTAFRPASTGTAKAASELKNTKEIKPTAQDKGDNNKGKTGKGAAPDPKKAADPKETAPV